MKNILVFLFSVIIAVSACAQESNTEIKDWRGENRSGVYNESNLLKTWPEGGPELLWAIEGLGDGYSSVTVANNTIYTTAKNDKNDNLIALSLDGKEKWRTDVGAAWNKSFDHSRTSPTVENNRVYTISGLGHITCTDANTGKVIWTIDGYTKFEGECGTWGVCESPLIVDNKVIYTPGGNKTTMVALDKMTGEVVWQSKSLEDKTGYVSPIVVEWAGKQVIINNIATYIFGVDAANGDILWKFNYAEVDPPNMGADINTNTPLFKNGEVFVTSGYNHTAVMLKLAEDGNSAELKWKNDTLDVHHGGVVEIDGFIYGSNWHNNRMGNWICMDWKTGNVIYNTEWENKGAIISDADMLYCYDEKKGNMALVPANGSSFDIKGQLKIEKGTGPHWAHPVIENGVLYVRHGDALMAYNIKE